MEIQYDLEDVVKQTILELEKMGKTKKTSEKTNYQNTESLLYILDSVHKARQHHEDMIKQLEEYGNPQKSHSITSFNPDKGYIEPKIESEIVEERINEERISIYRIDLYISLIDKAIENLTKIQRETIQAYYMDKRRLDDIAFDMNCSPAYASKVKKEAVKQLSIFLFPDIAVREILSSPQEQA